MIRNFTKSISAILYERVTSPLYGAFIISWSIWNWKIIYLTFFISETYLDSTKIDYITINCANLSHLIVYPLISTIAIILIIPFFGNAAYYVNLKFDQWKVNQKNAIERNQLLTLRQSIDLREELLNQTEKFIKMTKEKDDEIERLNIMISGLQSMQNSDLGEEKNLIESEYEQDYHALKEKELFTAFPDIMKKINLSARFYSPDLTKNNNTTTLDYLIANNIITKKSDISGVYYEMTDKGREMYRMYLEEVS